MITTKTKVELEEGISFNPSSGEEVSPIAVESMKYMLMQQFSKSLEEVQASEVTSSSASTASSTSETITEDDLYLKLRSVLYAMVGALEENKVEVSQFHANKAENGVRLDAQQTKLFQEAYDQMLIEMEEAEKQQEQQKVFKKVMAALTFIGAALISFATGGAAAALVMVTLTALATIPCSNGMSVLENMANSIATGLMKLAPGLSEETAQLIANFIVVAITVVCTLGVGAGANCVIRKGTAAGSSKIMQGLAKALGDEVSLVKLGFASGISVSGFTGTLSSAIEAMPDSWFKDEEQKEKVKMSVSVIEQVAAIFSSFIFAIGPSKAASGGGTFEKILSSRATSVMIGTTVTASSLTAIFSGILQGKNGETKQRMYELQADMTMIDLGISMNSQSMQDDDAKRREMLHAQAQMTNYFELSATGKALAQAMRS